ncbi:GL13398 [Drosophila persimilis]|uniref:GL13398 n=1 Tax=Drosophila persimilis TaxID=7234 RepID=B4H376_DROPE|nr:GL13398 [Drosophila persimilis]
MAQGFKELTVAMESQFCSLQLLNESPRRKRVTPRDLQVPTVTQPLAAEKLTPTTPSLPLQSQRQLLAMQIR